MRLSKRVARWAIAGLLIASVTGCTGAEQGSDAKSEDVVTLVLNGGSYSPLLPYSANLANREIGTLLFRGLTRPSASGDPSPDLLSELPTKANGGISADGRTVELRLKTDAKWQDGTPITAADVAFTLGLLREGRLVDDPSLGYDEITSVDVVDSSTVQVGLSEPNSPLAWGMAPYVLPQHLLAAEPVIKSSRFWNKPVGSGPYEVASLTPGREARLKSTDGAVSPLRVVFAQTVDEGRRAYDKASVAAWVGAPAAEAGARESVVETSSGVWRGWFYKARKGSAWADKGEREQILSLIPSESTATVPAEDPFGLPHAPRSAGTTEAAAGYLKDKGWVLAPGKQPRRGSRKADLALLFPTPNEQNDEWFFGIQNRLNSMGIRPVIRKADPPNVGGYFDEEYLTRASGKSDFDLGYTRVYFGYPIGAGWPFGSSDAPSWENPYGGNVFRVNEPTLDAAYSAVLAAGDPASARAAWQETGRKLKALGLVSWEYPEANSVRYKGLSGVSVTPYTLTVLESLPRWQPVE